MKETIHSYDGLAIPMTHCYNHYRFADYTFDSGADSNVALWPSPPLHLQLLALPTDEIIHCLSTSSLSSHPRGTDMEQRKRQKRDRMHYHAMLISNLLSMCFPTRTDCPIIQCNSAPLPENSTDVLLRRLHTLPASAWLPSDKQR
eukprot:6177603-Ditylum_brightwellii.AAC.2